jgi:adenine-specific DNA-methyltransferase
METSGIKYIGSKFNLLEPIINLAKSYIPITPGKTPSMIDVFTGTTRVAQAFRQAGWETQTSDLSWASETYAETFLQMNKNTHLEPLIETLNKTKPKTGWLTKNYCDARSEKGNNVVRVWQPKNGQKADAIRDAIEIIKLNGKKLSKQEKSTLVSALIFGLDKVDNTVGIQQAYLKKWCSRSYNDLPLKLPTVITIQNPPKSKHYVGNCLSIKYEPADLAYIDPPYSSHTYFSYYHIWDSIARWDKPEVGLKTNRRIDRVTSADEYDEEMSSPWNSKIHALEAFNKLFTRLPVKYLLVSYSNESLVPINDLIALARKHGKILVQEIDYRRNIMSQIGNGEVGGKYNKEYLILIKKTV